MTVDVRLVSSSPTVRGKEERPGEKEGGREDRGAWGAGVSSKRLLLRCVFY